MSDEPHHFCPGCGEAQRRFDRYPWYFCHECLGLAEDHAGRRLGFYNPHLSGGLGWYYKDDPDRRDEKAIEVICLIRARPVTVGEARFGGIVAEPTNSATMARTPDERLVKLDRERSAARAAGRLVTRVGNA